MQQPFPSFTLSSGALRPARLLAPLLVLAALSLLLAACGNGNDEEDDVAPPRQARETPVANNDTEDENGPAAVTGLGTLDSYRYTLRMEGYGGLFLELQEGGPGDLEEVVFEVEGAYVSPDRAIQTLRVMGFTTRRVIIADQQWISIDDQQLPAETLPAIDPADLSFAAAFWDEGFLPAAGNFTCEGDFETVNDVDVQHCTMDRETFEQMRQFGLFSDQEAGIEDLREFELDVWLAEEGYPVRLLSRMAGQDYTGNPFEIEIQMEITDINEEIEIEAPE